MRQSELLFFGKKVTHFTAPVGIYGLQGYYFSCRVVINNDGQGKDPPKWKSTRLQSRFEDAPGSRPKGLWRKGFCTMRTTASTTELTTKVSGRTASAETA